MSKITQETAQKIIDMYVAGKTSKELEEQFGLWSTSILNIVRGTSWKQCVRPKNIKKLIEKRSTCSYFQKGLFAHNNLPPLTNKQNQFLIGSLLGDGYLKKVYDYSPNSRFVKKQCLKFHEYLQWHNTIFGSYSGSLLPMKCQEILSVNKSGDVEREEVEEYINGYIFQTVSHPIFTKMREKWYPNNEKTIPDDIQLTPLAIAVWFCDDGCNSYSHREATFCTQSFTPEECYFLCGKLANFDVRSRVKFRKYASGKKPIIKVNSSSYDNLIHLIKPYITCNCMSHKIEWRRAKKHHEVHGQFNEVQITDIRKLRKLLSAKEIAKQHNVHVNTIYSIVSGRSYKGVGK